MHAPGRGRRILHPHINRYVIPPRQRLQTNRRTLTYHRKVVSHNVIQRAPTAKPRTKAPTLRILISGYNKQISVPTLQKFIEDHCPPNVKPLNIFKFIIVQDTASFLIKNKRAADAIVRLTGIRMGDGRTLDIRYDPTWITDSTSIKPLTLYVQQKYNAQQHVLDLRDIKSNQDLHVHVDFNDPDFITLLFRVLKLNAPETDALLLDNNSIHTLRHMTELHTVLPALKSLSLGSNTIANCNELDAIKDCDLINLILTNNPVVENTDREVLENAVLARFTNLQTLDQRPVQQIALGGAMNQVMLPPRNPSYYTPPVPAERYQTIIEQFFQWFDSRREHVEQFYLPISVFTLTLDQTTLNFTANDPQIPKYEMISINQNRDADHQRIAQRMFVGPASIANVFQNFDKMLPQTHTLRLRLVDALSVEVPFLVGKDLKTQQVLHLKLLGLFAEPSTYQRIFSRSLMMVPDSTKPLGFFILNDHLTMMTTRDRFDPKPVPQLSPQQQELVRMLMQNTNLKEQYALGLLQENGWDPARTAASYQDAQQRGLLKPEHFNS